MSGGGNWYVTGSRKLAEGMKGPDKLTYVTSECFSEPLGQSLDLFYVWNDWKEGEAPLLVRRRVRRYLAVGTVAATVVASTMRARLARTVFWEVGSAFMRVPT